MCYQQISVFRPIGTPWHVFFHRGCDIGDTWKYGQAWPNSGDSKVHFAHCGCNYCICRFGWSQLISSTSCDVQIWIAVSKMSFRSCSVAKSEMYHRRFWVRPALGLTWSIFAYNDTKLQPLPPTSKDTKRKGSDQRKLTSTDQLRTKAINWWPSETRQTLRRKCQALFRKLEAVWVLRWPDQPVRSVPRALCAPASLDTWADRWRFAHWEPLENKSKYVEIIAWCEQILHRSS